VAKPITDAEIVLRAKRERNADLRITDKSRHSKAKAQKAKAKEDDHSLPLLTLNENKAMARECQNRL
jgi:hypothetical protein